MKFHLENIGAIRYTEVEPGDFTIICGMNNSGKTYVTYAIYGFLHFWENIFEIPIDAIAVKKLKDAGFYNMKLNEYIEKSQQIVKEACIEYTGQLSHVFSAKENTFEQSNFDIVFSKDELHVMEKKYKGGIFSTNTKSGLKYLKEEKSDELTFTLFVEDNNTSEIPDFIVEQAMSQSIKDVVFRSLFPQVFIASAERTGTAIFHAELNFARNKLSFARNRIEKLSKKDIAIDPFVFYNESNYDYAWPVNHDAEFIRGLVKTSKYESEIFKTHENVINNFSNILGGDYQITDKGELFFVPSKKSKNKSRLTMDESSSSVRALLHIGFYLKHEAKIGDLLIIDEPELNLHPKNQRKVARLLASLVNCGIKVFITTHSDYILREVNNLILLNGDSPHLKQIIETEKYSKTEILKSCRIKVYIAKKGLVNLPGNSKKTSHQTLVSVSIDNKSGIQSSSFDDEINDMNRITDDIMFGG